MKTKKRFLSILLSLALILGLMPGMTLTAYAATYSESSINVNADGSVTATFTVSDTDYISNGMKGWLLSLMTSEPSLMAGSNNKIAGDQHPYGYENCAHYFFISSEVKSGQITVTWPANANDQKVNWSADGAGVSTNKLSDYSGGTWYFAVGPRYVHTGWGGSGVGAGTDDFWENCEYYIGSTAVDTQTITASDVTATYGDTDKSVSATTDGNGAISYAVKSGSENYIDVNASTGALTIKAVPADGKAYVTVTAAATTTGGTGGKGYAEATKEVTVTINKANAVAATVTANNRTYDGTEKPLVTVTGEATGGTMYYAVTTENTAPTDDNLYTTSIPAKTDAGTYYVWYKAVGNTNYADSSAGCVTVNIIGTVSKTVTFKVVNGAWNDETTTDKTVTLTGAEGTTLKLIAEQIPVAGSKPNDNYQAGSWDVTPSTETVITADTTYTYTYTEKEATNVSRIVTFKVVNGAWNDETTTDKTVTLTGAEGTTLKLTAEQIPVAGSKPNDNYQAGSWDETPSTETAISADKTYTYTYTAKEPDPTPTPTPTPESAPSDGATEIVPAGDAEVNVPVIDRETEKGIIEAAGETVLPTDDIKIIVSANNKSESEVAKDAEAVKEAVKNAGVTIGGFVDVTLSYTINNGAPKSISNAKSAITFFVPVPASMIGNDRIYIVYCIHWDPATGTVSITEVGRSTTPTVPVSSDKFSTYAIGYTTAPKASKATEPTHTHVYEWTVTREATESDDGCMAYACKICGDTLYQVPVSAYYTFNKSTMEKIQKAPQGATVSIVTDRWISFHKMVLEALNKRPDVTLKVSFLDGEYRGDVRSFTIPAGTDAASFAADSNFAGFMYIASKVGFDN